MKQILFILTSLMLVFTSIETAEAGYISGSGVIKKERRNISGAKYVVSNSPAKIILTPGSTESVTVETDDNIINLVNTYIQNQQLFVTMSNCSFSTKYLVVFVTMKDINGIKVKGSGDVVTKGFLDAERLKLIVEGSGDINVPSARAENLSIAVLGSGNVKIGGEADNINIEIRGSGDVEAKSFLAKVANAMLSGSGDCQLRSAEVLNLKSTGSGDFYLRKKPRTIRQHITGSGDIRIY